MKKEFFMFVTAILLGFHVDAQFRPGYYITIDSDTIRGFINNQGSIINCQQCEFRFLPEGEKKTFLPGEIRAYRFENGKYYTSMKIPGTTQDSEVFVEWLIKGNASIMSYTESLSNIRYFLLSQQDSLIELKNSKQEVFIDGKSYLRNRKEYVNTLKFYFKDCIPVQSKIENSQFKGTSLINITRTYHNLTCPGEECTVFEDTDRKATITAGLSTEILFSELVLKTGRPDVVEPLLTPGLGLAFKISDLKMLPPRLGFNVGLMFHRLTYVYDTSAPSRYYSFSDNRLLSVTNIGVPIHLEYRFFNRRFSPYLLAGVNVNFRFGTKYYDRDLIDYAMSDTYYDTGILLFQYGFNGGGGLEYKLSDKTLLKAGYTYERAPRFFNSFPTDHSTTTNSHFTLTVYYSFKK